MRRSSIEPMGAAPQVHKLAFALSLALMTNRTLVVAESAGWVYADRYAVTAGPKSLALLLLCPYSSWFSQ